jgi:type IV fimbrial biogenesis protein FimT
MGSLIVMAIVAILLQIAAPGFKGLLAESRSRTAISHARSLFALARQQAVFDGHEVSLCAADSNGRCHRDWRSDHEITVFIDSNGSGHLDPGEPVFRAVSWPMENALMRWRASLARPFVTFQNDGGTHQNGTLYYCPADGDERYARALVISRSGRSYQTGDRNGDGIREDRNGNNLSCP